MIVADQAVYSYTRKLANEFGIDFDPQGSYLTGSSLPNNQIIASYILTESQRIISKTTGVIYSGVGLRLDPANNKAFSLLKADRSVYSLDENGVIVNEGPNITLVAGYQVVFNVYFWIGIK